MNRYSGQERRSRSNAMSEADISAIAREAAREAVHETFTRLGVDMSSPEKVIRAQRTFSFLYDWHSTCQTVRKQAMIVGTTSVVGSVIAAIVFYWQSFGVPK